MSEIQEIYEKMCGLSDSFSEQNRKLEGIKINISNLCRQQTSNKTEQRELIALLENHLKTKPQEPERSDTLYGSEYETMMARYSADLLTWNSEKSRIESQIKQNKEKSAMLTSKSEDQLKVLDAIMEVVTNLKNQAEELEGRANTLSRNATREDANILNNIVDVKNNLFQKLEAFLKALEKLQKELEDHFSIEPQEPEDPITLPEEPWSPGTGEGLPLPIDD